MTNQIQKAFVGGIIGTAAMTLVMFGASIMGMPKMSPPHMLSMMLGFPTMVGWFMHFMIGIIFAMMYVFVINKMLKKISRALLKGAIFGVFAFIFGQVMIAILGTIFWSPPMEGSMMLAMIESILSHLIFGIVVALDVKEFEGVKNGEAAISR